jgi:hypothetical protein
MTCQSVAGLGRALPRPWWWRASDAEQGEAMFETTCGCEARAALIELTWRVTPLYMPWYTEGST